MSHLLQIVLIIPAPPAPAAAPPTESAQVNSNISLLILWRDRMGVPSKCGNGGDWRKKTWWRQLGLLIPTPAQSAVALGC